MPQMSPMNWLILMFLFTMILFMCISMIYYIYLPQNNLTTMTNPTESKTNKNHQLTWKW